MASMIGPEREIDTEHTDLIHDAQMDYYGKKLATCSSDRTVKIFDVREGPDGQEKHTLVKELHGHEGPIWQVAWAHPMFGHMLASCSHDRKVIIWKETSAGWEKQHTHSEHQSSVNSIAWGPQTTNSNTPILACASSDGTISILSLFDGQWRFETIADAHPGGVMSISWAPVIDPGSMGKGTDRPQRRLVSCGMDKKIRVWEITRTPDNREVGSEGSFYEEPVVLGEHTEFARDVAWAPSVGLTPNMIASCSQDGTVLIWKEKANEWVSSPLPLSESRSPVWRVSWSLTGSILAVSRGENEVSLWKESLAEEWNRISLLES